MAKTKEVVISPKERERIFKEELNEEAQKAVTEIVRLDAITDSSTLVHYYNQAVQLRRLQEEKERYGVNAFKNAKTVLQRSDRWLEMRTVIARKFDEPAILELAQKRDGDNNAFSWTHLWCLSLIDSKQHRKSLVNLWMKDSIPSTAFEELVRSRLDQLNGNDITKAGEEAGEGAADGEAPEIVTPPKAPIRVIKHTITAIGKVVESFTSMKKWNYKKMPVNDRKELVKLSMEIDTLNEAISTILAKFPVEDIKQSLEDEAASANAVLGESQAAKAAAKPAKPSKEAKTVKAPQQPAAADDDDDDLFGDVGGDAPISTDPADLVPVHSAKSPNRSKVNKKPAKKALAATGPGKDKRR